MVVGVGSQRVLCIRRDDLCLNAECLQNDNKDLLLAASLVLVSGKHYCRFNISNVTSLLSALTLCNT